MSVILVKNRTKYKIRIRIDGKGPNSSSDCRQISVYADSIDEVEELITAAIESAASHSQPSVKEKL